MKIVRPTIIEPWRYPDGGTANSGAVRGRDREAPCEPEALLSGTDSGWYRETGTRSSAVHIKTFCGLRGEGAEGGLQQCRRVLKWLPSAIYRVEN
jgi:hypothetical protein